MTRKGFVIPKQRFSIAKLSAWNSYKYLFQVPTKANSKHRRDQTLKFISNTKEQYGFLGFNLSAHRFLSLDRIASGSLQHEHLFDHKYAKKVSLLDYDKKKSCIYYKKGILKLPFFFFFSFFVGFSFSLSFNFSHFFS